MVQTQDRDTEATELPCVEEYGKVRGVSLFSRLGGLEERGELPSRRGPAAEPEPNFWFCVF